MSSGTKRSYNRTRSKKTKLGKENQDDNQPPTKCQKRSSSQEAASCRMNFYGGRRRTRQVLKGSGQPVTPPPKSTAVVHEDLNDVPKIPIAPTAPNSHSNKSATSTLRRSKRSSEKLKPPSIDDADSDDDSIPATPDNSVRVPMDVSSPSNEDSMNNTLAGDAPGVGDSGTGRVSSGTDPATSAVTSPAGVSDVSNDPAPTRGGPSISNICIK